MRRGNIYIVQDTLSDHVASLMQRELYFNIAQLYSRDRDDLNIEIKGERQGRRERQNMMEVEAKQKADKYTRRGD